MAVIDFKQSFFVAKLGDCNGIYFSLLSCGKLSGKGEQEIQILKIF